MIRNDDLFKGVAIGLGLALVAPVVIAAMAPVVKPIARSAFKAGVRAYEMGREAIEEIGETVDDVVAEVEEELFDTHNAPDMDVVAESEPADAANGQG
jgi:hypothetical protein